MKNWVPNFRVIWPKHKYIGDNPRRGGREPIAFQELRLMKLRNVVGTKDEKGVDNTCLQEMAVMFACLKSHDFKEANCAEEILSFQKCDQTHKATLKALKKGEGALVPGAKDLTARQLNTLLKKYPQFNE